MQDLSSEKKDTVFSFRAPRKFVDTYNSLSYLKKITLLESMRNHAYEVLQELCSD
jgi:Mg/Co/Ni transporter MgtE